MNDHSILRVACKALIPAILVFALYVQFHGDFGAGGGFQAGVIAASAIILYGLVFGMDEARRVAPPVAARIGAALGVVLYAGTGLAGIALGGNYLDYFVLPGGQHAGIMLVELGVLFAVASVMVLLFYAFAGRVRDISDEDW